MFNFHIFFPQSVIKYVARHLENLIIIVLTLYLHRHEIQKRFNGGDHDAMDSVGRNEHCGQSSNSGRDYLHFP